MPKRKVYVGNMIDTVPVSSRGSEEIKGRNLKQDLEVSRYLGSFSKAPPFAHGMGALAERLCSFQRIFKMFHAVV